MFKQALTSAITSAIVTVAIIMAAGGFNAPNFAGVTHLSGLSVGSDGLAVTDGGAVSLGSGTISATGTTTISKSYDGFTAFGDLTIATGTAKAVITNSTGIDWMCDAEAGYVDMDSGTSFAPSLTLSAGTSTSATDATWVTNLMSSSTVATTTDKVSPFTYALPFKLASGNSIIVNVQDGTTGVASSTYFTRWNGEIGVPCTLMGQ